jgi:hypothetical protein
VRLLKCNECGRSYKHKPARKRSTYICTFYSNKGNDYCKRNVVKEEDLDFFVEMRYERKLNKEEVQEVINRVEVNYGEFHIHYKDGYKQSSTEYELKF